MKIFISKVLNDQQESMEKLYFLKYGELPNTQETNNETTNN